MQNIAREYYKRNIEKLEKELKKMNRTNLWYYFFRLTSFVGIISMFILFLAVKNGLYIGLSGLIFLVFLFIIQSDLKFKKKRTFLKNSLMVNQNEVRMLDHDFQQRSPGEQYHVLNPALSYDFDLFGKGSVFQYLNRSSTRFGESLFAENLCHTHTDTDLIRKKQETVRELKKNIAFVQEFMALGLSFIEHGKELGSLKSWLNEDDKKIHLLRLTAWGVPLINLVFFVLTGVNLLPVPALLIPVFISFFVIYLNKSRIQQAHMKLGRTARTFEKYGNLIRLMEKQEVTSVYLAELKKQFTENNHASKGLAALLRLLNSFDFRYNPIMFLLLNTMLVFDIQIYLRLIKWRTRYQKAVPKWFDALATMDELISYAVFAFNNQQQVSFPEMLDDDEFILKVEKAGHPLIKREERVNNDFKQRGYPSVTIITGANMAGKSTFLRTIAVNLLLAMNGAPVIASRFIFTPCDIMSSIRIRDSLSKNESYFYAELKRLKEIIHHVQSKPKTLVILDELLRGTNSRDKQSGTIGLLENLISFHSAVIVATHDLSVGKLEKQYPEIAQNHCFEVELVNDRLDFDYILKPGVSQKLNASFLLKKMQIMK